jgi:hypothetical protein
MLSEYRAKVGVVPAPKNSAPGAGLAAVRPEDGAVRGVPALPMPAPSPAAKLPAVSTCDWIKTRDASRFHNLKASKVVKAQSRRYLGDVAQDIFLDHGDNRALSPLTLTRLVYMAQPVKRSTAFAHLIQELHVTPDFCNPATRTDLRERVRHMLVRVAQHPKLLKVCNNMALHLFHPEVESAGNPTAEHLAETFDRMEIEVQWACAGLAPKRSHRESGWLQVGVGLHRRAVLDQALEPLQKSKPGARSAMALRMALRNAIRTAAAGDRCASAHEDAAAPADLLTAQEIAQVRQLLALADAPIPEAIQKRCEFIADVPRWRAYLDRQHPKKFDKVRCLLGQQGLPPEMQTPECVEAVRQRAVQLTRKAWDKAGMAEVFMG